MAAERRAIRRQPEVSRGEILDAALACFTERGYYETSVDAIAARAGLSKGAIYWHFAGKRELFLALVDRFAERGYRLIDQIAEAPDWKSALQLVFSMAREQFEQGLPFFKLGLEYIAQSERDEELRARAAAGHHAWTETVQSLIARGVADGTLRPVPGAEVALLLDTLFDGLALAKLLRPELEVDRAWTVAEEIFWRGVSK